MAKGPEQTDSNLPLTPEVTVFIPQESRLDESQEDAEKRAFAEEVEKRLQRAYHSVGLRGQGKETRKQTFLSGYRQNRRVSKGVDTGDIEFEFINPDGQIVWQFHLGIDRGGGKATAYHYELNSTTGRHALGLIDEDFNDIFPIPASPKSPASNSQG